MYLKYQDNLCNLEKSDHITLDDGYIVNEEKSEDRLDVTYFKKNIIEIFYPNRTIQIKFKDPEHARFILKDMGSEIKSGPGLYDLDQFLQFNDHFETYE